MFDTYIERIRASSISPVPIFLLSVMRLFMKYSGSSISVITPQYTTGEPSGRQVSYIFGRRLRKKSIKSNCVFHSNFGSVNSNLPSFSEK